MREVVSPSRHPITIIFGEDFKAITMIIIFGEELSNYKLLSFAKTLVKTKEEGLALKKSGVCFLSALYLSETSQGCT